MCGEKRGGKKMGIVDMGSPPRVRGEETAVVFAQPGTGITPACAGRSRRGTLSYFPERDHPRVCGEKRLRFPHSRACRGSPPRVRGEACVCRKSTGQERITPACAGRSGSAKSAESSRWDHPRVCGEKPVRRKRAAHRAGSPPRVRGEVDRRAADAIYLRITPACAGRSLDGEMETPR